jgi:hypothetical protein
MFCVHNVHKTHDTMADGSELVVKSSWYTARGGANTQAMKKRFGDANLSGSVVGLQEGTLKGKVTGASGHYTTIELKLSTGKSWPYRVSKLPCSHMHSPFSCIGGTVVMACVVLVHSRFVVC